MRAIARVDGQRDPACGGRDLRRRNAHRPGHPVLARARRAVSIARMSSIGDNTWRTGPIASAPLKPLHDQVNRANHYVDVGKKIDLDDYAGLPFQVWASTPAVLWTANRPQERG